MVMLNALRRLPHPSVLIRGALLSLSPLALLIVFTTGFVAEPRRAQVYHQIEGRIVYGKDGVGNMRVRLVNQAEMRPITETFSRPDGQFRFTDVAEGDYLVETFENDKFDASTTSVPVRPFPRGTRTIAFATVELSLKSATATAGKPAAPGVLAADVDVKVPKEALKHYRAGVKAIEAGDKARGLTELRQAVRLYPDYYAARLELGRELGAQKLYEEAEEILKPLGRIAPRRAESRVEYGKVLLALKRGEEAAGELLEALRLDESNWETSFYLGWAFLETDGTSAEQYLRRALELNERKAARAHLALARLAEVKGRRQEAIRHLEAYLALAPDAPDAEAARRLAESLRR